MLLPLQARRSQLTFLLNRFGGNCKLTETCYKKSYYQALTLNASSNGGDASRVGEICSYYLAEFVFSSPISIPTRDASPPLEIAFRASV